MRWFAVTVTFGILVGLLVHDLGGTDGKPLSPGPPKHEAVEAAAARSERNTRFFTLVAAQIAADEAARLEAERVEAERVERERLAAQKAAEAERKRRAAEQRRTATGTTQAHTAPSTPPVARSGVDWDAIARCESNGRWNLNTGNGFYGGLQFMASSWRAVGGTGLPHEHSRETQIAMAERLSNGGRNLRHWPVCGRHG